MSYEEMTDFEINKAVAETKGLKMHKNQSKFETLRDAGVIAQCWLSGRWVEFDYCNNPSDAWPIIVENKIAIRPLLKHNLSDGSVEIEDSWEAYANSNTKFAILVCCSRPLRAAMIVYLRMNEDNGD